MFFRLKPTQSGQVLKLIESYRDDTARPRHRTVASLGNAPLPRPIWKPISKAIDDRLYERDELIKRELNDEEKGWVDRIVRQVLRERRWKPFADLRKTGPVIQGVLAEKVTHTDTAELGPVWVGWRIWQRLGMPKLLDGLGFSRSQRQAAAISVINRLAAPTSEHGLLDWYRRTGLPELMGHRLRGAGDDRFYRISDLLLDHQRAIEKHLRERQRSLFNLSRTVLLYDLTNTHFEGACKRNPKARRGVNKQKRNDCPQIVVGMIFDSFGFEMGHQVFEGNMNDGKSLLSMIAQLNASVEEGGEKPLVIMDGGVATRKNLALLKEHGFGYLVNDSRRQRKKYKDHFLEEDEFCEVEGREGKESIFVRVLNDPNAEEDSISERVVLCKSQPRRCKEEAILSNAERRFLEDVKKLAVRVEKKQLKDRTKIQQAIGRLQAKHFRVHRYYRVELEDQPNEMVLRWTRDDDQFDEAIGLHGCYVLRTDEQTLNEHELWKLYISLTHAENGFKALKTDLGLRPNPHHKEDRVDGHVFICVLAYHLLRNILWTLEQKGDSRNWESLKQILQTHCYTTILLPTENGQTHRIRKAGQPEECQKSIYRNLDLDWHGLPSTKSVTGAIPAQNKNQSPPATL